MFAGFGLASNRLYGELQTSACGQQRNCTDQQSQNQRQAGKTEQLVANISLATGSAAALATITFAIIAATSPPATPATQSSRWHLLVGATSVGVSGEFP
jgi:hypothetical protein